MCKYLVSIKYENLIEFELIYFQGCESKILYVKISFIEVNYSIKVL
jgi:hypothetical protein